MFSHAHIWKMNNGEYFLIDIYIYGGIHWTYVYMGHNMWAFGNLVY